MKKLLVLSALLGLLALPVFATHVSIDMGGDLTFGFIGDFGDNEAEDTDLTWDVIVGIDDFNSFTWSLKGLDALPALALDKALVTTDIGKWLDLPVGIKLMWGYDDPDANEFGNVTAYENQVYDFSPLEYWGVGALVSYMFLEFEVAFNPGVVPSLGYLLAGLSFKEPIAGLNAEVYFFQAASAIDTFDQSQLGIGASYQMAFGDVSLKPGVSFLYDMDSAALFSWAYSFGVKAIYKMIEATADLSGQEDNAVSTLRASVEVAPVEKAAVYAGMVLSFVDGTDTFQGADIGLKLNVGVVDVFLGYNITSNTAGEWHAPADLLADGGMYLNFDVDY